MLHRVTWGKPIDPHQTSGSASTLMDVNDKLDIERLTWAVYDRVLLPSEMPELSSQHSWSQIIMATFTLIYKGRKSSDHCPHAQLHHSMPHRQPERPELLIVTSSYSGGGGVVASLDHHSEGRGPPLPTISCKLCKVWELQASGGSASMPCGVTLTCTGLSG